MEPCKFDLEAPFYNASFALYRAQKENMEVFQKWRTVMAAFDKLRGYRDPVADSNVGIDVLLRSFEDECRRRNKDEIGYKDETAGLQFHFQLSRLWVSATYEYLRTLHSTLLKSDGRSGECLNTGHVGCGKRSCKCCAVGHLKNDFAVVRVPMTKNADAGDVLRPPLPQGEVKLLKEQPVPEPPPHNPYVLKDEGMTDEGVIAWVKLDKRIQQPREFTRRSLSDSVLNLDLT